MIKSQGAHLAAGSVILKTVLATAVLCAQIQNTSLASSIQHTNHALTVQVDSPRPVHDAAKLIREEYGWLVDYEDRPYTKGESVSIATSRWRQAHPDQTGILIPVHQPLNAIFAENHTFTESTDKASVLAELSTQYNSQNRAGSFKLVQEVHGRVAVVGLAPGQTQALGDTQIVLPTGPLDGLTAFDTIIQRCSQKSGFVVRPGSVPINVLSQIKVLLPNKNNTCRDAVALLLDAGPNQLVSSVLYDPTEPAYVWNVTPAMKVRQTASGQRDLEFLPERKPVSQP